MSGLIYSKTRHQPLSWCWYNQTIWCLPDQPDPWGTGIVRCSRGHHSVLVHNVLPDGRLVPPAGESASMHCGTCDEDMPLMLEGWREHGPKVIRSLEGVRF